MVKPLAFLVLTGGLLATLALPAEAQDPDPLPPVKTIDYVDLERYLGLWYEIAKIPNKFQNQCTSGATAQYTLRQDGAIDVVNSCRMAGGKRSEAQGKAEIVDTSTNAKLRVSFVSFLGWRPFWGDYWIIGLDPLYRWAVVGHPERKYGWILARNRIMEDSVYQEIMEIVERNGYEREVFVRNRR